MSNKASAIVKQTPAFIYDMLIIEEQINAIINAFKKYKNFELFYSIKANYHTEILKLVKKLNLGASVSSEEELQRAKKIGFKKISYTAPYTPHNISTNKFIEINFNNFSEITTEQNVGLRVNPLIGWSYLQNTCTANIESQFGIPINKVKKMNLSNIIRLHMHTSSDSYKIDIFTTALKRVLEVIKLNPQIKTINIGGGIAVPIGKNEKEFNISLFAQEIIAELKKFNLLYNRDLKLQFEPGNYIVRPSGQYICKIIAKEEKFNKIYYFTDGTKHHLKGINTITKIITRDTPANKKSGYIVGKTCQRGDIIFKGILPELNVGDIITIPNTGAYCFVQADNFHLIPKPKNYFNTQQFSSSGKANVLC